MSTTTQWFLSFVITDIIFMLLVLTAYRLRLNRIEVRGRNLLVLLRLMALGVLLLLAWQVLFNLHTDVRGIGDDDNEIPLTVLVDHSLSMDFKASLASRRAELAEGTKDLLRRKLRAREHDKVVLKEWAFAETTVPIHHIEFLKRDHTALFSALSGTAGRSLSSLCLILSDGTSTEGILPSYLAGDKWQSTIKTYAICCDNPTAQLYDVLLKKLSYQQTNPTSVEVKVVSLGQYSQPVVLEFSIDKKTIKRQTALLRENGIFSFPIAGLEEGWHELKIQVSAGAGERTNLNNLRKGIFKITQNRILVLTKRPRLENLVLIQTLNRLFPGQVQSVSVVAADSQLLQPGDYAFIIAADVAPGDLPDSFLTGDGSTPILILPGENFHHWRAETVPRFPIKSHRMNVMPGPEQGEITFKLRKRAAAKNGYPAFIMPLYTYHEVTPTDAAREIISFRSGDEVIPLLRSEDSSEPHFLVLLTSVTWKWARSTNAEIRRGYDFFWKCIVNSCLQSGSRKGLDIFVGQEAETADEVRVHVRAAVPTESLKNVSLTIAGSTDEQNVALEADGPEYTHLLPAPAERPAVLWLQAAAERNGEKLVSELHPVLFEYETAELNHSDSDPEILRKLAGDDRFAFAEDAEAVVDRLIQDIDGWQPKETVKVRNKPLESSLATLLFLLLAIEWYVERRIN